MEPESLVPHSPVPAICPYPEPARSKTEDFLQMIRNRVRFYGAQPPSWRTTSCPHLRLLIQYIRRYHPYWRLFLHSQPEDAPCRGDRDPLITHGQFLPRD